MIKTLFFGYLPLGWKRLFRAGRAEMLKKEIKVSDSKKQIEEIFAAEVLENVKKGWEKV
jgi:hypothetical protein